MIRHTLLTALLGASAGVAVAGVTNVQLVREVPDEDRWMYPFNASSGAGALASNFGAILLDGFDDHDAQFFVGFDTDAAPTGGGQGLIEAGLGEHRYAIVSAKLTLFIGDEGTAEYDADYDSFATFLPSDDPDFVADTDDPGQFSRPIMLFGSGYRNNFGIEEGQQQFVESSPFGGMGFPVQGVRNAFATDYFEGAPRDISNNLKGRFEVFPFAVGKVFDGPSSPMEKNEGEILRIEDRVEFELDLSNPDVVDYLRYSLNNGTLAFCVTSLHVAFGGPGGGEGVTYPVFFTKEDTFAPSLGQAPRLELEVDILPPTGNPDFNGDGVVDSSDLADVLATWGANPGSPADLNGDGVVDSGDLAIVLASWG